MKPKSAPRGLMVQRLFQCCQKGFVARQADVNRGWARFCSKSCAKTPEHRWAEQRAPITAQPRQSGRYVEDPRGQGEHPFLAPEEANFDE